MLQQNKNVKEDRCFPLKQQGERRGRGSGTEIVKVPPGIYASARHQMCLKWNIRSSSLNASYPLVFHIDRLSPACLCLTVSQEKFGIHEKGNDFSESKI